MVAAVDDFPEDPDWGFDVDPEDWGPGGGLGGGGELAEVVVEASTVALARDQTGMCVRFLRLANFCLARDCYGRDGALGASEIF